MKKLLAIICIFMITILAGVSTSAFAAKSDISAKKDIAAPSITNTYPKNKEKDVMVESTIIIRFDEKIQKGKVIAKLGLSDSVSKAVAFTYEMKDNILLIIPKDKLKYNTEYKLTIPAGSVKDSGGLALSKQYLLSFTTEKSLYQDQSDLGIVTDEPEEDTSDTEDPTANANTVNLNLEMTAYVTDMDFSETDKANAINALKKIGVYVRSVSSEIQIPTDTTYYDVVLEWVSMSNSSSLEQYFTYDLHIDSRDASALTHSVPSIIAENLSRTDAEMIKYRVSTTGGRASLVEHVTDPEEASEQTSEETSDTDSTDNMIFELVSISGGKYPVMRILRDELNISLYDAYMQINYLPFTMVDVSPELAYSLKTKLERVGAEVNILEQEDEEE